MKQKKRDENTIDAILHNANAPGVYFHNNSHLNDNSNSSFIRTGWAAMLPNGSNQQRRGGSHADSNPNNNHSNNHNGRRSVSVSNEAKSHVISADRQVFHSSSSSSGQQPAIILLDNHNDELVESSAHLSNRRMTLPSIMSNGKSAEDPPMTISRRLASLTKDYSNSSVSNRPTVNLSAFNSALHSHLRLADASVGSGSDASSLSASLSPHYSSTSNNQKPYDSIVEIAMNSKNDNQQQQSLQNKTIRAWGQGFNSNLSSSNKQPSTPRTTTSSNSNTFSNNSGTKSRFFDGGDGGKRKRAGTGSNAMVVDTLQTTLQKSHFSSRKQQESLQPHQSHNTDTNTNEKSNENDAFEVESGPGSANDNNGETSSFREVKRLGKSMSLKQKKMFSREQALLISSINTSSADENGLPKQEYSWLRERNGFENEENLYAAFTQGQMRLYNYSGVEIILFSNVQIEASLSFNMLSINVHFSRLRIHPDTHDVNDNVTEKILALFLRTFQKVLDQDDSSPISPLTPPNLTFQMLVEFSDRREFIKSLNSIVPDRLGTDNFKLLSGIPPAKSTRSTVKRKSLSEELRSGAFSLAKKTRSTSAADEEDDFFPAMDFVGRRSARSAPKTVVIDTTPICLDLDDPMEETDNVESETSPALESTAAENAQPESETRRSSRRLTRSGNSDGLLSLSEAPKLLMTFPFTGHNRISINTADLERLNEGEFLNDSVIDFYLRYVLETKMDADTRDKTYVFSSFFYRRLTSREPRVYHQFEISSIPNLVCSSDQKIIPYEKVKKWTAKIDLFAKNFLVIPINENAHWYLAIVCYPWRAFGSEVTTESLLESPERSHTSDGETSSSTPSAGPRKKAIEDTKTNSWVIICDSLGIGRSAPVKHIKEYLCAAAADRRPEYTFSLSKIKGSNAKLPLQPNHCDCGVFLLHYFEKIFCSQSINDTFTDIALKSPEISQWFGHEEIVSKRIQIAHLINQLSKEYTTFLEENKGAGSGGDDRDNAESPNQQILESPQDQQPISTEQTRQDNQMEMNTAENDNETTEVFIEVPIAPLPPTLTTMIDNSNLNVDELNNNSPFRRHLSTR